MNIREACGYEIVHVLLGGLIIWSQISITSKCECLFSGNIRVIRLMTVCYQRVALSTKKQSLIRGPSAALSSDAAMINAMSFTVKWAVLLQYWSRPKKRNESKKFRVFSEGTLMLPSALTGHLNLPSLFSRAFELWLHLYNCFCVRVSKTFKPEQLLQTVKQLCWNVGVLTFPLKHPEELAYMLENDMQPILKRTWTLIIYTVCTAHHHHQCLKFLKAGD